jgi:hypothetical protein
MKITKRQLRRIIKEATAAEMERWESDYRDPQTESGVENKDLKYDHPSEELKSKWSSDERDEPSLLDRFKSMLSDEEREKMDSYDHPSEELKKRWVSESSLGDRPSWEDDVTHPNSPDYDPSWNTEVDDHLARLAHEAASAVVARMGLNPKSHLISGELESELHSYFIELGHDPLGDFIFDAADLAMHSIERILKQPKGSLTEGKVNESQWQDNIDSWGEYRHRAEVQAAIEKYSSERGQLQWRKARNEFEMQAAGEVFPGITDVYYVGWTPADFQAVIDGVEG